MKSSEKQAREILSMNQCVFILGHPLTHTLSPSMHNAAFRSLGIPLAYLPLDVLNGELGKASEVLRSPNVLGANVTVPYKAAVITLLDQVHPEACRIGSVNTVYKKNGKLLGTSTDGEGFLRSLGTWRKKLKGSTGLLVGAGGSASAVTGALAKEGVKSIYIANRTPARAYQLARMLKKIHPKLQTNPVSLKQAGRLLGRCNWAVQTTSVGLKPGEPSPVALSHSGDLMFVVDLIYNRDTAFLKAARSLKLPALNGLGMLLQQGALSFEYWTGRKPPLKVMRKALADSFLRP